VAVTMNGVVVGSVTDLVPTFMPLIALTLMFVIMITLIKALRG
jgi:ABC-type transporter Mla subunit MlaD